MNSLDLYLACSDMDDHILARSEQPVSGQRRLLWLKWGTAAACLCLILTAAATLSPHRCNGTAGANGAELHINWENVAVNQSTRETADSAMRNFDTSIYAEEIWGTEELLSYYGWDFIPGYIPEGLVADDQDLSARILRERETGLLVVDYTGRGYWSAFYEDGSPKSDDDLYIPTGFTISASKLGLFRCGLLPVDDTKTTDFGGIAVTLNHCSMPYGPFDPTQQAPNGLYNLPAGYYDIYTASFEFNGAEYEIMTQRLELEELIRITASILNAQPDQPFIVGSNPPALLP
ncbi:MAG: hypothetical protein E7457_00435 [Ruminococcaceae bacterium]|nr:hypothetical protein [Oscillospiraceae bacterium]